MWSVQMFYMSDFEALDALPGRAHEECVLFK